MNFDNIPKPVWILGLGRFGVRLLDLWILLAMPVVVQAQFNYTTDTVQITITGYIGGAGAVSIPATINGLPVRRIADNAFKNAFKNYADLTSVTIPDSVTSIGDSAFSGCTGLTSVTIPNSVTRIGSDAFQDCPRLTSVTIPNSVTSIRDFTFDGCTGLTSVTIPNSVTSIGYAAFSRSRLTNVTIGNSVTIIGDFAFSGCTGLTSVTIPNSVTSIGYNAFNECTGLTSVTIPNSVTIIGDAAFWGCTGLTSVTIPNSVTSIGYSAFRRCTGLKSINVDSTNAAYASVDGVLFNKKGSVLGVYPAGKTGSYKIPDSVTSIEGGAFSRSSLTSVTIPNSVTSIGDSVFSGCTGLTSVTIPNSVTIIGDYAFSGCTGLTSVTIPSSVTSIGNSAFKVCSGLQGVYFLGNPPSVSAVAFVGATAATVYYLPGTKGWNAKFAGRPTVLWNSQIRTGDGGFGVKAGQFGFNVAGNSGLSFVVEATTNLGQPVWTPVSTNTLSAGTAHFSDPQWQNHPTRFYRITTP